MMLVPGEHYIDLENFPEDLNNPENQGFTKPIRDCGKVIEELANRYVQPMMTLRSAARIMKSGSSADKIKMQLIFCLMDQIGETLEADISVLTTLGEGLQALEDSFTVEEAIGEDHYRSGYTENIMYSIVPSNDGKTVNVMKLMLDKQNPQPKEIGFLVEHKSESAKQTAKEKVATAKQTDPSTLKKAMEGMGKTLKLLTRIRKQIQEGGKRMEILQSIIALSQIDCVYINSVFFGQRIAKHIKNPEKMLTEIEGFIKDVEKIPEYSVLLENLFWPDNPDLAPPKEEPGTQDLGDDDLNELLI